MRESVLHYFLTFQTYYYTFIIYFFNCSISVFNSVSVEHLSFVTFLINSSVNSGKIIFFLEGGYNLDILQKGVINTIKGLMKIESIEDSIEQSQQDEPNVDNLITELRTIHNL